MNISCFLEYYPTIYDIFKNQTANQENDWLINSEWKLTGAADSNN